MKISFDLDDTLILSGENHEYEDAIKFPYSLFYKEKLRKGTLSLFNKLKELGYNISVYTTSERTEYYIRKLFKLHGIKLDLVINLPKHLALVQGKRNEIMPSKLPSKFNMDLHIDDDKSVKQNGIQYGFNVLIIDINDKEWTNKILTEAKRIIKKQTSLSDQYQK